MKATSCTNRNLIGGLWTIKNLKIIYTVTDENAVGSWSGKRGRINKEMITRHLGSDEIANAIFYICGPPAMLKAMQELLQEFQVQEERIKVKEFTGY